MKIARPEFDPYRYETDSDLVNDILDNPAIDPYELDVVMKFDGAQADDVWADSDSEDVDPPFHRAA